MDQLKLPICLLTVQKTIMYGHSQVIDLQIKQNELGYRVTILVKTVDIPGSTLKLSGSCYIIHVLKQLIPSFLS